MKIVLNLLLIVLLFQSCSTESSDYEIANSIYKYYKNNSDLSVLLNYSIRPRGENSCYIFVNEKIEVGYYLCNNGNDTLTYTVSSFIADTILNVIRKKDSINYKNIFASDIRLANKIITQMNELDFYGIYQTYDSAPGIEFIFSKKITLFFIQNSSLVSKKFKEKLDNSQNTKWLDSRWVISSP